VRRASLLLLSLFLFLPACGQGQPVSLPPAQLVTEGGLELTEIRRAAVRFLEAYARSASNIEALKRAVVGQELEEWVYWLDVQNQDLGLSGDLSIDRLRVLNVAGDVATVGIDATVTFTLPEGGDLIRRFESPLMVARQGESWSVFDATRDGRSMQESISVIDPPARDAHGGVTVEVGSVFRFTAGTAVNVLVLNGSAGTVKVDPQRSLLQVGAFPPIRGRATSTSLQDEMRPGQEVEGMIEFPPIPLERAPNLVGVALRGRETEGVVVNLPPEAFAPGP
jgi:predicted small lipoprotein YifL